MSEEEAKDQGQEQFRKISKEERKRVFAEHKEWVESDGKAGRQADWSRTDLLSVNLEGANLTGIDLHGANLKWAKLQRVILFHANLQGARLGNADLKQAQLNNAVLREANLQDADLWDATGLQAGQLAGANVSNARLPDSIDFKEPLGTVEHASKNARVLFLTMLLACVYSWITIATTVDAKLLTNSASSPLPIIGAEIPIVGFYWAAPLLLLGIFLYFHLYLQRLWELLATLPAVFPDGTPLDRKAYPWLLNSLVRAHVRLLREDDLCVRFSRLQRVISYLLAWWTVPVTLLFFWARFLPLRNWYGTGLHILLLAIACLAALAFLRHTRATLRQEVGPFRWVSALRKVAFGLGVAVLFVGLSIGAFEGSPAVDDRMVFRPERGVVEFRGFEPDLVPKTLRFLGIRTRLEVSGAELSTRPKGLTDTDDLSRVRGVQLKGVDLRYLDADGAFLARADLAKANLRLANLGFANLEGANLQGANLQEVNLQGANLKGANLQGANLQGANLQRANLKGTYLDGVNLQGANLVLTDLRQVYGLSLVQLRAAWNWERVVCDADLRAALGITQREADWIRRRLGLPTEAEEEAQKKADAEKKSPPKKPDK